MPKDPSKLYIDVAQDPGLVYASQENGNYIYQYPTNDNQVSNTIVNIIQYNLNTVGANNEVLINSNDVATGDPEFTYDANTNTLFAENINVGNLNIQFNANLGNVSNLHITGGTDGYVLSTDGRGNLSWTSQQVANVNWNSLTGKPTFATVATSGNYNDLTNKPANAASTTYVDNRIANITWANLSGAPSLALVATSGMYNDLDNVPNLSGVALSGDYNDLANLPSIPSISGLATETYVDDAIANVTWANLSGKPTIPTHTSNLINNSGYITSSALPTDIANLTDNTGLLNNFDSGNITFNGDEIASTDDVVNILGNNYAQLQSGATYVWVENNSANIEVNGNVWGFDSNGNITLPSDSSAINYSNGVSILDGLGGQTFDQNLNTTDDVTFNSVSTSNISSPNNIEVITTYGSGSGIDLYTDWSGNGVEVWLQHNDRVSIKTENGTYEWAFDNVGNLVLPQADMSGSPAPVLSGIVFSDATFQNTAAVFYDQSLNTSDSVTFNDVRTQTINFNSGASISEQNGDPGRYDIVFDSESNVIIKTDESGYTWTFGNNGYLTLATNAFDVNYANGSPVIIPDITGLASNTDVANAIANLVNSSPAALNTLNEFANALGNDASFSTTISTALGNRLRFDTNTQNLDTSQKANAVTNLGLADVASSGSYNDLLDLPVSWPGANISGEVNHAASANSVAWANVSGAPSIPTNTSDLTNDSGFITSWGQADWNESATESSSYIQNKPSIPTDISDLSDNSGLLNQSSNPFDQDLNTSNSVTFTDLTLSDGGVFMQNGGDIYSINQTNIDIYTDWDSGQGVEVWLKHNDKVEINTNNGQYSWSFDNTGNLSIPSGGDILRDGVSVLGQNIFNQSLNTTDDVTFNSITIPNLNFGQPSIGAPQFGGGTDRLTMYNFYDSERVNYAVGVEPNYLWFCTDLATSQGGFKFYGGEVEMLSITGDGKIHLVNGGDIVDSNGQSVIGINPFDQDLNTTNDVTFNSIDLSGATITSNGLEIYTKQGSGGSIDIYTDWSGTGTTGGLDLWLIHNDGIYLKTHDGDHVWKFDDTGKLHLPSGGDIVDNNGISVLGGSYGDSNVTSLLGSFGSNSIYTGGTVTSNSITLLNSDDFYQIYFSNDGETDNGHIKVDGGTNMVVSAASNFYVKQAGSDRLSITNIDTTLGGASNVIIKSSGSSNEWNFGTNGDLTVPNDILANPSNDLNLKVFNPSGGGGVAISLQNRDIDTGSKTTQFDVNPDSIRLTTDFGGTRNEWTFDNAGILSLPLNASGASTEIKYGTGNLVVYSDGGWTIGEFNGTNFGTEGIRINPGIEGTVDITLPSDNNAATQDLSITNGAGNVSVNANGNYWKFRNEGSLDLPNYVRQNTQINVQCPPNMDTVIYTGTAQWQHTFKILIKVEGRENGIGQWETQSCEMMVAKSINGNKVAGSVYGLVYTSDNPLATFNARWNSSINRVEILCRPTSTVDPVDVRSFVTEIKSSD